MFDSELQLTPFLTSVCPAACYLPSASSCIHPWICKKHTDNDFFWGEYQQRCSNWRDV